ncbi:MAG: flagellar basal body rod protein FlgB [Vampirovibrionales bacterium]|nr:flagellar basal body rod protein FlgB [Vampirovibrionales bacterium]
MDLITSLTSEAVGKALDGVSLRHKSIASNLANAETPGYHRADVSFENELAVALKHDRERQHRGFSPGRMIQIQNDIGGSGNSHVSQMTPKIEHDTDHKYRNDGNSVDVESELVALTKNTQRYMALVNLQTRLKRQITTAIQGG